MVATVTDEQSAARELVRGWARTAASGAAATAAVRDMEYGFEEGNADAWRPVFAGLAGLGLFGVAVPEDCGGAGGSIEDLCAMVDEAARALVPGPVATTAVATLVVSDPKLRSALASGERFAGVAIDGGVQVDPKTSTASGTVGRVLGGAPGGVVLLPADGNWLLVDTACDEVVVEPLRATDFSLPLARMVLTSAPVTVLEVSGERVEDLAATVLAAEAAGVARWTLDTAVAYAKVREQFGKPIGSFQAVKHLCAQMLCRAEQAVWPPPMRPAPQPIPMAPNFRSPRRWPRASASTPPKPTPRTVSRCSVVSAAPGSTTRICICAGPTESVGSSVDPGAGCVGLRR
ncbi:acyl-CoA dehydrogenase FADE34 [Mycobacterium tuberculosis]|nr:acyl-CoA dehydrogenase FADE34 [Mycobacterium tuberculosis]